MPESKDQQIIARLAKAIGQAADYARERLARLVEMESPSGDVELLDALAVELAGGFHATGATSRRVPGPAGDHLVIDAVAGNGEAATASAPADGGALLVLGHYDTVLPRGHYADHPFRVNAGEATGPGAFDMKGGIVALEIALRAVREVGATLAWPLRLVLVSDEELGSPDGAELVRRELDGARAVIGLEPPQPDGGLKTGRRGVARMRVSVTGRAAHAGLDAAKGISAIDELLDQLIRLRTTMPTSRGIGVNVGTIEGGGRANVVSGHAFAEIGLRFATADEEDAVFATFDALESIREGARIEVTRLSHRPAWQAPEHNAFFDHVRDLAASLGQSLTGAPSGGAGDTNLPGSLGLPTLDGFGPRGRGAHSSDEVVELASILDRASLLAALLVSPPPDDVIAS
jgi:glutamate carboxypeptidase